MEFDDLIFVSAQPDVPYFHWQTKVYVHNFIEKGINPNQIHVLFVIVDGDEPSKKSLELKHYGVNVHHYVDNREHKEYIPTLRPLILSKWLKENPQFGKCYFYHDSDIIFRVLPDFNSLIDGDVCYLSDTTSYIGYDYIKECCDRYDDKHNILPKDLLLTSMCGVIGIDVETVKKNQSNSGGAQYLIKNTDYTFWDKVYKDSENLYQMLIMFHKTYPIQNGLQIWTSDMWAVLWNLWYLGKETRVTDKLSFSWGTDTMDRYNEKVILHMAGVTANLKHDKFYKGDFITLNPIELLKLNDTIFDYIDDNSATKKYIEVMESMIKNESDDYLL
jgi:hypothetical protein